MENKLKHFVIITPCYNESQVILTFLEQLANMLSNNSTQQFTIVVVDDGSVDDTCQLLKDFNLDYDNIALKVISLKFNMGHQLAIKQGLMYAQEIKADGYIVMDSDGEDDPKAILKLIESETPITFVTRGKRKESLKFKIGYYFYKILFKMISGNKINFGNYSMIKINVLNSLVEQNFIHYSAFLSKMKYNKKYICFDRNKRIDGKSKMNSNSLVIHGLKSIIEYSEEILFFFMKLLIAVFLLMSIYEGYVFYDKFISHKAISGWTSTITLSFIIIMLVIATIIILGLLLISQKERFKKMDKYFCEVK